MLELNSKIMSMKYYLFNYSIVLLVACISCSNGSKKEDNSISSTTSPKENPFQIKDLQGVWSEDQEENALFFIRGDSLWYVEDQEKTIKIEVSNDTLVVWGSPPFYCKIMKLDEDSLCYIDNITNEITRLVRIK